MKKRIALAAFVCSLTVAISSSARADGTATGDTARTAPTWSLGGGLVWERLAVFPSNTTTPLASVLVAVPGALGLLERRVTERSWVFLDVSAFVQRYRADVDPNSSGWTRLDERRLGLSFGVRTPVTRAGAPVEVSFVGSLNGSVSDGEQRRTSFGSQTREDDRSWSAGANAGIAVQRELTEGLALRVATPILFGSYGSWRASAPGQPTRRSTSVTVGVDLAPQLELVAFF